MAEVDDIGTFLGDLRPVVYPDRNLYRLLNSVMDRWNVKAEYRRLTGCDVGPFNNSGIPTIFFSETKPANGNGHFPLHSPKDDLDLIDIDKLFFGAEIVRLCVSKLLKQT